MRIAQQRLATPTRLYMTVPGLPETEAHAAAIQATINAQAWAPKMTGQGADTLYPIWSAGWFGFSWTAQYLWFQEVGIRAFTMSKLRGRVIPMWVNDQDGSIRAKNPKAEVRTTASGRTQVLIFRRATGVGSSRDFRKRQTPKVIDVPLSYAGAPGRIDPATNLPTVIPPQVGGAQAIQDTGIRWRHPGLDPRGFMHYALYAAARSRGLNGAVSPGY